MSGQGHFEGGRPGLPPVPGTGHPPAGPTVGWLELFFDLVFVASVIVFSNTLSHELSWNTAAWVGGSFVLVWWTWLATTMLFNRFRTEGWVQRGLVLLLMFLITLVTAVAGNGAEEHRDGVAGLFGVVVLVVAALYHHAGRRRPELAAYARRRRDPYLLAGVIFMASAPFEGTVEGLIWAAGAVVLAYPVLRYSFRDQPDEPALDRHHLVERVGLFTIIMLGEAFVKVALVAADGSLDELDFEVMAMQFIIVFSAWSAYFDDIPAAGLPSGTGRQRGWLLSHLPLHLAIVGTAVGAGKLLTLQVGEEIPTKYAVVTAMPLALAFVALALIGVFSPRRPAGPVLALRLVTAVFLLGVGLITRLSVIDVEEDAALLALVCAAHAIVAHLLRRRTAVEPAGDEVEVVTGVPREAASGP